MAFTAVQFGLIVLLILANGFFAASEIAVVSARRGRLQSRAEAGSRGARIALELAQDPNRFLATVQVGITVISTFAAAFGGDSLAAPLARVLTPYTGPNTAQVLALTLVVMLISYLSLILGELVPKRLALQYAESYATLIAPVMRRIAKLAAPVVWFLTFSTQLVLRLLGRTNAPEEPITEEDVLSLVREGAEEGTVEAGEQELIQRVFDFTDVSARAIMTPRTEIVAVEAGSSLDEVVQVIVTSGYSRIPVYTGTLDTVTGIIYAKDVLRVCHPLPGSPSAEPALQELLRPPVFVLEHQRIATIMQQFKQSQTHLALVLDEYGQVDGLLTLEDILEELTGDIADEYDEADTMVVRRADGSYLVDGLLAYTDAVSRIGLPARADLGELAAFETVAGLMLALLQHIPAAGEIATVSGWTLEVVDMDGVRIDKLLVRPQDGVDDQAQNEAVLALGAALSPSHPATAPPDTSADQRP